MSDTMTDQLSVEHTEEVLDGFDTYLKIGSTVAALEAQIGALERVRSNIRPEHYTTPEGQLLQLTKMIYMGDEDSGIHIQILGAEDWSDVAPTSAQYTELTSNYRSYRKRNEGNNLFYGSTVRADGDGLVWVYDKQGSVRAQYEDGMGLEQIEDWDKDEGVLDFLN